MSKTTNTVLGVLAASAVGAALGILFAPDKGSRTRGRIQEGANRVRDGFVDKANYLGDEISTRFTTTKNQILGETKDLVNTAKERNEEELSHLEDKLNSMKDRNSKISANQPMRNGYF